MSLQIVVAAAAAAVAAAGLTRFPAATLWAMGIGHVAGSGSYFSSDGGSTAGTGRGDSSGSFSERMQSRQMQHETSEHKEHKVSQRQQLPG